MGWWGSHGMETLMSGRLSRRNALQGWQGVPIWSEWSRKGKQTFLRVQCPYNEIFFVFRFSNCLHSTQGQIGNRIQRKIDFEWKTVNWWNRVTAKGSRIEFAVTGRGLCQVTITNFGNNLRRNRSPPSYGIPERGLTDCSPMPTTRAKRSVLQQSLVAHNGLEFLHHATLLCSQTPLQPYHWAPFPHLYFLNQASLPSCAFTTRHFTLACSSMLSKANLTLSYSPNPLALNTITCFSQWPMHWPSPSRRL